MVDPHLPGKLEPSELLRVMDAAQVIRARQERMEEGAFDRDATVREIQVMYEDLGDLVDRDTIEQALDLYLSERYAFKPAHRGPSTTLAWAYVRRGMLTRRVVAPVAIIGAVVWGGISLSARMERASLERNTRALRAEITSVQGRHAASLHKLNDLRTSPVVAALQGEPGTAFRSHTQSAEDRLAQAGEVLTDLASSGVLDGHPTSDVVARVKRRVDDADAWVLSAQDELDAAQEVVQRKERLTALAAEIPELLSSIRAAAREPGVAESASELAATAAGQAATGNLAEAESAVDRLRQTLTTLGLEYHVEIVGGVWRYQNENHNVRNYYLRVRAVDADGEVVPRSVQNEENGLTEVVREWGERVPKEIYDRVAADKQDNGLIDDSDFGTKKRGWMSIDRKYPDVGQITRW